MEEREPLKVKVSDASIAIEIKNATLAWDVALSVAMQKERKEEAKKEKKRKSSKGEV